ncbi:MAG: serpin family protein, partial [Armatimonadota bacterium]
MAEHWLTRFLKPHPSRTSPLRFPEGQTRPLPSDGEAFSTVPAMPAVAALNTLGCHLFRELSAAGARNTFISPTSLMLALAMTYNGARGETQTAMAKALQVSDTPTSDLNAQLSALRQGLGTGDRDLKIETPSSLWVNKGYAIKPQFARLCATHYRATACTLDFTHPLA